MTPPSEEVGLSRRLPVAAVVLAHIVPFLL